MSNIYTSLPVPAGNGVGAAVDVSPLGALKTIVVVGTAQCTVNVEYNNDPAQLGSWQSAATIQNSGAQTVQVACRWMRTRISNFNVNVGGTSGVNVGGINSGSLFTALPVPAGNGAGAAVDVSAFGGTFKTVQVGGPFRGTLIVEVSEDGTVEWAQPFSFGAPGADSQVLIARFMRVRRVGVPVISPGLPVVNVGFALVADVSSGGAIVADGNYGDVTVSLAGTQWTVNPLPESRIVGLVADLAARVPITRQITTTAPLTIDGGASADLSANRTLAINTSGLVPSTRTLQGTAPISINGSNAPQDLSANRIFAVSPFDTLLQGVVNASGGAGNVLRGDNTWQTLAQFTAALNLFTTTLQGVVPASGAAPNFLRGDATWSTIAQVTAALNVFTTVLQGLVPASGAAANFLRGDATWSTIAQVTAALDLFTTTLRGLTSPSGAAANFLRGDNTWSTVVQVTAALNLFTTTLQGLVPASGAAGNVLRGNATWSTITQLTAALDPFTTALQGVTTASTAAANFLRGDNTWSTVVQVTAALNLFTTTLQGLVPASGAAGNVLRGNATWSTITQLTAALDVFTSVLQGVVPASGGGTANFLRADGTWAAPTSGAAAMFDTVLNPATITFGAAFDNWNPGALGQNTLIRCTTDGSTRSVRGMVGGVDGKVVCLANVNSSTAVGESWVAEDAAATAANRFRSGFTSGGCLYRYDGTLSRWVLITGTP